MTTQESFKKRIRARMAKTGERYSAARRALIEQTQGPAAWVSQPEASEEAIRKNTGRGWEEWVALLDAGPGAMPGTRRSRHGCAMSTASGRGGRRA